MNPILRGKNTDGTTIMVPFSEHALTVATERNVSNLSVVLHHHGPVEPIAALLRQGYTAELCGIQCHGGNAFVRKNDIDNLRLAPAGLPVEVICNDGTIKATLVN